MMSTSTPTPPLSLSADLLALHASFQRSDNEIHGFQLSRLQSCSTVADLADYEAEITVSIDGLKRTLTHLELAVDDAETARERKQLAALVADLKRQLELTRQATRKALVAARRNVKTSRTASAREGLQLAADSAKERTGGRGGGSSGQDKLMTTSQDVTDALRRTVTLMSSELEKSALSSSLLEESSQTLTTLSSQYGSLSTLMTNSAQIIKSMERQDLIGKGMLAASMLFFLSCVAYILYVRLISRGFGVVGFFWRLLGFGRLFGGGARSLGDVKEKMEMAKQAAATTTLAVKQAVESVEPGLVATAVSSAAMVATTTAAAAPPPPSQQQAEIVVEQAPWDGQGDLDEDGEWVDEEEGELVETVVVPEDLFDSDPTTLTRHNTRPTERVEL